MLYQLSYSRNGDLVARNYAKETDSQFGWLPTPFRPYAYQGTMATPLLPPATNRLVGLLLLFSGFLLGLGLLLKIGVMLYAWNTGAAGLPVGLLAINLLGLLAGGLLMRWGLRMRRGQGSFRNPNADEIL
jgi:hypothetical protein